jgi:hypothetical protein
LSLNMCSDYYHAFMTLHRTCYTPVLIVACMHMMLAGILSYCTVGSVVVISSAHVLTHAAAAASRTKYDEFMM